MNETLLGVPKATLLKAMEIVNHGQALKHYIGPNTMRTTEKEVFIVPVRVVQLPAGTKSWQYRYDSRKGSPDVEHAFRVWLGKHGCHVLYTGGGTDVYNQNWKVSDPHHLTAQARAVCKIELEARLTMSGCGFAGPGRGDCEHFLGLPGKTIPGQHDGPDDTVDAYGKPNGWCWYCWLSHKLAKAEAERDRLRDAAMEVSATSAKHPPYLTAWGKAIINLRAALKLGAGK